MLHDDASGAFYFQHVESGEVSWEAPEGGEAAYRPQVVDRFSGRWVLAWPQLERPKPLALQQPREGYCMACKLEPATRRCDTCAAPRFELGHVTAEGLASAFLGGTVGAVGSVVAIEAKRVKVKKSKQCPYCDGTGAIACAACLGTGLTDGEPCRLCGGRTVHTCENCKGRGRFIPTMLDARVSRDPETELEEIGLQ